MECGFESNWELYPVCASHVFFQVQGRIPKGWNRPIFWPKTPMWKGAAAVPCGDMMAVLPSTFLCSRTQCILKRSLLGDDVFRNTWDSILNSGGASLEANILNFFWNSLVVVAPTRPPATGHHESVLWKSTQHTAELVAYHGVTPVSKQPCERQRHGCCPAQWIWDTVYDECYKGGQPDLSLLLLAGELYLRDAAQAPPFFWRAPLTRSNTSTVHSACKAWAGRNEALEGAVQHDKLENEKFSLRLTAWPSEPPFINLGDAGRRLLSSISNNEPWLFSSPRCRGTAHKSISSYLTTLWSCRLFKHFQPRADFCLHKHHWPEIRSFNELTNLTGFTFISDTRSAIESCLKCHPRNGFSQITAQVTPRKGKGTDCCFIQLLSTQSSHGTTLAKCRISPATGHWLTALDARHWHCTDCSFFQYLEARTFLESPKNSCHSAIVWQAAWWTCSSQRWDLEEIEQRNRGGPDAKCWRQRWIGLTSCVRKQTRYTRPARPTLFWAENVAATFWQTSCRWLSVFLWPTTTSRISSSQGQH